MNEKKPWEGVMGTIGATMANIRSLADALGNPAESMTAEEAKAAFDAMTEEEAFCLIDRQRLAEEGLGAALADKASWFRRKGQLAARIVQLRDGKAKVD